MGGAVFPPCSLASGQTMVGVIVVMASFKMTYACGSQDCCSQCPWSCSRPLLTHASTKDSWRLTGKSGSVSCRVTAPFSWVLVHTRFCFSGGSLEHLWRIWALILNTILPLPPSRLGFSFAFCFSSFLSYLKGLLRQPFCLFAFLFLGDGFDHCLLYSVTNLRPQFFRHSV